MESDNQQRQAAPGENPYYEQNEATTNSLETVMRDESQAVRKRSVRIGGHATSISLEQDFWDSLRDIADQRGVSVNALITEIDKSRGKNLSSAIRVYILQTYVGKELAHHSYRSHA